MPHTHIGARKWQWKTFQLAVAYIYIIIFDMLRILTEKVNSVILKFSWTPSNISVDIDELKNVMKGFPPTSQLVSNLMCNMYEFS